MFPPWSQLTRMDGKVTNTFINRIVIRKEMLPHYLILAEQKDL